MPSIPVSSAADVPLPNIPALLDGVERNQQRMEALQRDYTYHVRLEQQELDRNGGVTKTQTEDAESLTLDGVRVDRVVARNGKPLSEAEKAKEDERINKTVARAKERRARIEARGDRADAQGDPMIPLSRILQLGTFSNPRRAIENGRPTILIDYAGDPRAKTRNAFETVLRDVVGTIWIDEADRAVAHGEGRLLTDFKLGGGLLASIAKGSTFAFGAARVENGIWLPATVDGRGSARLFLLTHFNGRMHLSTSDYRRFHASATIIGSHGPIGADGVPLHDTPSNRDPRQTVPPPGVTGQPEAEPKRGPR